MSVSAMTWAYRQRCQKTEAKFLLVTMADVADCDDICAAPASKLAMLTQMSETDIEFWTDSLAAIGMIKADVAEDGRMGYRLTTEEG